MKTALFILLASAGLIYAEEADSAKSHYLGEITVTGKYEGNEISPSARVNQEEINRLNPEDAASILNMQPGFYVYKNSRNEAVIISRGFDQRQIAAYFDGAPVYIPNTGEIDFSQYHASSISSVNSVKGMPVSLYGSNSMGGALNFISPERRHGYSAEAKLQAGTNYNGANISHGGAFGNFFWNLNGAYYESEGLTLPGEIPQEAPLQEGTVLDNSSYTKQNIFLKAGYRIGESGSIAASFMDISNVKGVPVNIYSENPRYWKFSDWGHSLANIMGRFQLSSILHLKGNLYYAHFNNVLNAYDDGTYTTQEGRFSGVSTHNGDSFGGALALSVDDGLAGQTKITFAYKYDTHEEQDNIGAEFEGYESETITAGVEKGAEIGPLQALAGMKYDWNTPKKAINFELQNPQSQFYWHAGLKYSFTENLRAFANTAKNGRYPTLKESYSNMRRAIPNPGLRPEMVRNYEIGADFFSGAGLLIRLAGFYSSLSDLISVAFLDGGNRQFVNIGSAEYMGIELSLNGKLEYLNYKLNYTYLSAENTSPDAASPNLPHKPENMANLSLFNKYGSGFGWSAEYSFRGGIYSAHPDNNEILKMDDYSLFSAQASYEFLKGLEISLRANNIFGQYYETSYGFPAPGREFIASLKYYLE